MSFRLILGISVQHLQAGAGQHATPQGLHIRLLQRPQPQEVAPLLAFVCNVCDRTGVGRTSARNLIQAAVALAASEHIAATNKHSCTCQCGDLSGRKVPLRKCQGPLPGPSAAVLNVQPDPRAPAHRAACNLHAKQSQRHVKCAACSDLMLLWTDRQSRYKPMPQGPC